MKKIKTITVIGKRWFQKSYGNIYCSATIYIDGVHKYDIEPTYGYGDYYLQAAGELLIKEGVIKHIKDKMDEPLWLYCNNNGITLQYEVSDVSREKDL